MRYSDVDLSELNKINYIFLMRYGHYYDENNEQWYIIDFGSHRLWLHLVGCLAPLFFKYIKLKAYPVDEEVIKDIVADSFVRTIQRTLAILVLMSAGLARRGGLNIDLSRLTGNQINKICLFIFFMVVISFLGGLYKPKMGFKNDYVSVTIIAKIHHKKKLIKIMLAMIPALALAYFGFVYYERYLLIYIIIVGCTTTAYSQLLFPYKKDAYGGQDPYEAQFIFEE